MTKTICTSKAYELLSQHHTQLGWAYWLISYIFHRFKLFPLTNILQFRWLFEEVHNDQITFFVDGLRLVGNVYFPQKTAKNATILLLHGSSVFGRKVSLMRVLAQAFQGLGYAVIRFDLRGYGESDDPNIFTPKTFEFAQDVSAAIDWIEKNAPEHSKHIYIIGHSFGGAVALAAQAHDLRLNKIVVFGPPRRLSERFLNPEAREKQKLLVRWQADMQLKTPLTFELWQQVLQPLNIENYTEAFTQAEHRPVFLIDAENEPPADLEFLRTFYHHSASPIAYWTVAKTDHYLNTGFLLGHPCYQKKPVYTFVNRVDQWLQNQH